MGIAYIPGEEGERERGGGGKLCEEKTGSQFKHHLHEVAENCRCYVFTCLN